MSMTSPRGPTLSPASSQCRHRAHPSAAFNSPVVQTRLSASSDLDLDRALESLSLLLLPGVGLCSHDTTAPVASVFLVFAGVALVDGADQLAQLGFVLTLDLGQGQDRGGLLVDNRAEAGFALDDGIGDAHLAAERGEEDNQFNGVHVVRDQDQRRFLRFNQTDHVVETVFDGVRFLWHPVRHGSMLPGRLEGPAYLRNILLLLALLDGGGLLVQTLLLLGLGLRAVLV